METLAQAALTAADDASKETDHAKRDALQQLALRLWMERREGRAAAAGVRNMTRDLSASENALIAQIETALRDRAPGVYETKLQRALSLAAQAVHIPKGYRRARLFRDARALYVAAHEGGRQ